MRRARRVLLGWSLVLAGAVVVAATTLPGEAAQPQEPEAVSEFGLVRDGADLRLDGLPVHLAGVNAYSLTTDWSVNWGCGTQVPDPGALLDALPRGALVRTWAFRALAFDNKQRMQVDFTTLDRVVAAAEARGLLLTMALSDQAGTCDDGHWHDRAWYSGGFRDRFDDDGRGLTKVSFERWVQMVVSRYADSPAVAVWEPVNEPEASDCAAGSSGGGCYGHGVCEADASAVLRSFFDEVGGTIHRLDPGSLVASGVIGGGQCGLAGGGYEVVHGSPGLDVATFHDYGAEGTALPGELADRLRTANRMGMPLLVEEAGIGASEDPAEQAAGCRSRAQRASAFDAKVQESVELGADGYLAWWLDPAAVGGCTHALSAGDPVLAQLGPARPGVVLERGTGSSTGGGASRVGRGLRPVSP